MATIREIADEAGVSVSSVSIVLSGHAEERRISRKTQERILEAARKYGYAPNIMARQLRSGEATPRIISMYQTADSRATAMIRFSNGMYNYIKDFSEPLRLFINKYVSSYLSNEESLLRSSTCNGAIICNANMADLDFLKYATLPFPAVLFNACCPGYDSVGTDHLSMGREAALILATQDCRRAVYFGSYKGSYGTEMRYQGFVQGCQECGLEVIPLHNLEATMRDGYHSVDHIMAMSKKVDCALFSSELHAVGALRRFQELGVRIPEQMKLIAVGNSSSEISEFLMPQISIFYLPLEEMAKKCIDLLIDRIDGGASSPQNVTLPYRFIARDTCGLR